MEVTFVTETYEGDGVAAMGPTHQFLPSGCIGKSRIRRPPAAALPTLART